jgi:methylmalonyl-CoA mutase C-terminal domain/subunit
MEVIYTGMRQTPDQIVAAAIDEDVDVIGVSTLSGAHMYHLPRILGLLRERSAGRVTVIVGGTVPPDDARELKQMGVAQVFPTDSDTNDAIEFVRKLPPKGL